MYKRFSSVQFSSVQFSIFGLDFIGYYFIFSIIIFKVQFSGHYFLFSIITCKVQFSSVQFSSVNDARGYLAWTLLDIIFFLRSLYSKNSVQFNCTIGKHVQ